MRCEEKLKQDGELLVEFLNKKSNEWTSKEEICQTFPDVFVATVEHHSHDICTYIWTVKDYVNKNIDVYKYCIISNSKGELKIPSKPELIREIKRKEINASKSWKRVWTLKKSLGLIGQITLEDYIVEVVKNGCNWN